MLKKLSLVLVIFFVSVLYAATSMDTVDVSLTVQGSVFALELKDANEFPLAGEIDLGKYEPGDNTFPVNGVIVAGCKSNTGAQWSLQAESTELSDPATGRTLASGALRVRGLDSLRSPGGVKLPGSLVTVDQTLTTKPIIVYTSNSTGDLGFNNAEGTYVALGLGVNIPGAQPSGTYNGRVILTLTE